jgi:hypothetical protein
MPVQRVLRVRHLMRRWPAPRPALALVLFVLTTSLMAPWVTQPLAQARASDATGTTLLAQTQSVTARDGVLQPKRGVFGKRSEWKRKVQDAPTHPFSASLVSNLANQVRARYGGVAAFNAHAYNSPFYAVKPDTPRVRIKFHDCQHKGYVPDQLYVSGKGEHFNKVPMPEHARVAAGSDREITVWDSRTDQLWEFWQAKKTPRGWQACWGGRIDRVSRSHGYFKSPMGATATGLPLAGGYVGIREARAGVIDHALALVITAAADRTVFSYPAQRSDGTDPLTRIDAIPEGLRFRLPATLDLSNLGLSPVAMTIAVAAQKYGFIVVDTGGAVAVVGESGAAAERRTGVDPWKRLLRGEEDYEVMQGFPWHSLEALPMDFGEH